MTEGIWFIDSGTDENPMDHWIPVDPDEWILCCDTLSCEETVTVPYEAGREALYEQAEEDGWVKVEDEDGEDLNYCPEHAEWIGA